MEALYNKVPLRNGRRGDFTLVNIKENGD